MCDVPCVFEVAFGSIPLVSSFGSIPVPAVVCPLFSILYCLDRLFVAQSLPLHLLRACRLWRRGEDQGKLMLLSLARAVLLSLPRWSRFDEDRVGGLLGRHRAEPMPLSLV